MERIGVVRSPFTYIVIFHKYLENKSELVVSIELALKMKHKLGKLNPVFKTENYYTIDVNDGEETHWKVQNVIKEHYSVAFLSAHLEQLILTCVYSFPATPKMVASRAYSVYKEVQLFNTNKTSTS